MFVSLVVAIALAARPATDGGAYELPPVDVAVPPSQEDPLPSSPTVRDPSATLTTRDARGARAEAKDAAELISTTPGAIVQDSGGAGQRKTLSLRGAAPNAVLVLLDGVPLAGPGAALDLARIPTAALDKLEVLRGGGSARYGPGAMGGVVNLVTKAPQGGSHVFADVTQGSFVTTQLSLGGSTELLGGDGLVLLHGLRSEGTFDFRYDPLPALEGNPLETLRRTNNGALQGGGLLRFRRRLGATQLDVLGEGVGETRGLAGPVQNPSSEATQTTGRGTLSVRTSTSFEAGGALSSLAWGRFDDTTLSGTFFGAGAYRQRETSAGAELVYTRLFGGRHGVTALLSGGGDWLFAPGGLNPAWGRFAALAADEVLFLDGALSLNGSARVDVAGRFVVFSPKLGAVVELPQGVSLRANAGQASRPPSFTELYVMQGTMVPNADLRPERALTGDVGAWWKNAWAHASVTGFLSLYEDLISYEYYPPNLARPYNFQAARVAGVEVEAAINPWRWLEASVSYTFLDTQNQKDDPRYYLKSLPFRPAHRLHARVSGGPEWLKARAEVLFQSAQFTNRTETLSIPARALVNVGVTARPLRDPLVTLSAELKNVLDVQTQDVDGYPLPPRALFLTLGFGWDAPRAPSTPLPRPSTREPLVAAR